MQISMYPRSRRTFVLLRGLCAWSSRLLHPTRGRRERGPPVCGWRTGGQGFAELLQGHAAKTTAKSPRRRKTRVFRKCKAHRFGALNVRETHRDQSNERTNDHCNEDKIEPGPCVNPTSYTTLLTPEITRHFQTPPINCFETSTPIVEHPSAQLHTVGAVFLL